MQEKYISFKAARPSLFDALTLTKSSFLCRGPTRPRLASSMGPRRSSASPEQKIDYAALISPGHSAKAFSVFLKVMLAIPEIVVEEETPLELSKKVRSDPKKCYSARFEPEGNVSETFCSVDKQLAEPSSPSAQNSAIFTEKVDCSVLEVDKMTPEEIRKLVEMKMRKMDAFNSKLEEREKAKPRIFGKSLAENQVSAIRKFQRRFRMYLVKKHFFKSLRMNDYLEHKKAFYKIKRCLDRLETEMRAKGAAVRDATDF